MYLRYIATLPVNIIIHQKCVVFLLSCFLAVTLQRSINSYLFKHRALNSKKIIIIFSHFCCSYTNIFSHISLDYTPSGDIPTDIVGDKALLPNRSFEFKNIIL